jgi:hypothetical protein
MLESAEGMRLRSGLEFAPGTTEECKRLVARLFTPTDLFGAYRMGRDKFKTGDLVLIASERDMSGIEVRPRISYLKDLRTALGHLAQKTLPVLGISRQSAQAVVKLPFESDAMWLVVSRGQEIPVMCVIFSTPYEIASGAN